MADDETPDTPAEETPAEETPVEHAVPTDEAKEIAGTAEDAPLEALQEAEEGVETEIAPTTAEQFEPTAGHAVPTEDATEIAGAAEDAPLEAAQEAEEQAEAATEVEAGAAEAVEAEIEEEVDETIEAEIEAEAAAEIEVEEEIEESAPREKPAVPGAHLEVDIVPEGVDPLGRDTEPADPYAIVAEAYEQEVEVVEAEDDLGEDQEALAEPISTAAIDLAAGARYRATGKRKTAIARVTLKPGSGDYVVNGRHLEEHFPRLTLQRNIRQPLETVGYQERMDVVARLHGGGISAQAGALRHGVSRALLEADPNLRGELKRRGFLTRDSRAKERKKAGLKKARKRPQFSKR